MGNKKQLIEYLLSNYTPGQISWQEIADKFGFSNPEAVRAIWKNYRKSNSVIAVPGPTEEPTATKKGNFSNDTFESQVTTDFEPKGEQELANVHKVELDKYKITNYWSKTLPSGKFTSSVFCTTRKLGSGLTIEEIKDAVSEFVKSPKALKKSPIKRKASTKSLVFFITDEHIGAAVTDGLYDNEWNESVYLKRKSAILDVAATQADLHGSFDSIIIANLGDTLDGFSEQTTRGGHKIQQNMTNKQAIKTYLEVNGVIWDGLMSSGLASTYKQYNIENSNHGGLGWDAAANIALDAYLSAIWDNFESIAIEKIIGSFSIGSHDFHLTHGKDEKYMKRNLPFHLDFKTESYLKEYLEENNYSSRSRAQHFLKGDLHKFATEQGKYFTYTNVPSLFGSSAWVMANFGNTRPGFCYAVVEEDDLNLAIQPYWYR